MTDKKKGYGNPPEGRRWKKGESGNPAGRPPKPLPTWAQVIESEWSKPITLANGQQEPAIRLILLHLSDKTKNGDRRADRVFRKFGTVFRKKLRLAYGNDSEKEADKKDGRHKKYEPGPDDPLSEKERKYRAWQRRVQEIYPPGGRVDLMSAKDAAKFLHLLQKRPECPTSRDVWRRRRSKKLSDTEIFDQVLNSPVILNAGGRRKRVPRMGGMITLLVEAAARGVDSAEVLINLHRDSTKNGDFGIPKTPRK